MYITQIHYINSLACILAFMNITYIRVCMCTCQVCASVYLTLPFPSFSSPLHPTPLSFLSLPSSLPSPSPPSPRPAPQIIVELTVLCQSEQCAHLQRLLKNMGAHHVILELLQVPYKVHMYSALTWLMLDCFKTVWTTLKLTEWF